MIPNEMCLDEEYEEISSNIVASFSINIEIEIFTCSFGKKTKELFETVGPYLTESLDGAPRDEKKLSSASLCLVVTFSLICLLLFFIYFLIL